MTRPRKRSARFGVVNRVAMSHYPTLNLRPVIGQTFDTLVRVRGRNITFTNCWFRGPQR